MAVSGKVSNRLEKRHKAGVVNAWEKTPQMAALD